MAIFTDPFLVAGGSANVSGNSSTASRVYQMSTIGEIAYDEWEAALAPGIPREGEPHPMAGNLRVSGVVPRRMPNAQDTWQVTVNYTVPSGLSTSGSEDATNPLADPAQVSWGAQLVTLVATEDVEGSAIVDTAGIPVLGLETSESLPVLTIVRNERKFTPGAIDDLVGSVNINPITLANAKIFPRKGMIMEYGGERIVTPGLTYWRVRYQFIIHPRTWDKRVAMVGWYDVDGSKYTDEETQTFASEPIALSKSGQFIKGQPAYVKRYRILREQRWKFSPSLANI